MAFEYGNAWVSEYGEEIDEGGIWSERLAGLTTQQIKEGFDLLPDNHPDWPPKPMQFRNLCLPSAEKLNLPTGDQAYLQACRITRSGAVSSAEANWQDTQPAIYHAYMQLDKHSWREASATLHKKMFIESYQNILSMVFQGAELDPVPLAIEAKEKKEEPEESEPAEKRTKMAKLLAEHF